MGGYVTAEAIDKYRPRRSFHGVRIFLAGATGAVGRPLTEKLVARGHRVTATTRSSAKADLLRRAGAEPAIVDGLDEAAVREAVVRAQPDAIIHQMTALAGATDLRHFDATFARTNELRTRGTDHLIAAAIATGVERFVAQSYTNWTNTRAGGSLKTEEDPLDPRPPRDQRESLAAIRYLERAVLDAPLTGMVLRYGNLYGPGASEPLLELVARRRFPLVGRGTGVWSFTHVDDAAAAAVAAVERGSSGLYNIVDDEPAPAAEWLPYLARLIGAPPPLRIPAWLARLFAGEAVVSMMTKIRGSSNAKAKRELGWRPIWSSWHDGFRTLVALSPERAPRHDAGPAPAQH